LNSDTTAPPAHTGTDFGNLLSQTVKVNAPSENLATKNLVASIRLNQALLNELAI
jgi:hypothetical protein